jgi:hypothetical protein
MGLTTGAFHRVVKSTMLLRDSDVRKNELGSVKRKMVEKMMSK